MVSLHTKTIGIIFILCILMCVCDQSACQGFEQNAPRGRVLVIGIDGRLQGVITAWDLAEEFVKLVDPFKRIEEIEVRLRTLLTSQLGVQNVANFLKDQDSSSGTSISGLDELTIGELQRVIEYPKNWCMLNLAFDRKVFISAMNKVVDYRNRLMHFRDPLTEDEMTKLTDFCDLVREIPL